MGTTTSPSWKTKKGVVLGLIGVTAAVVVAGATLFCSIVLDSSGEQPARTEAVLLRTNSGGSETKCERMMTMDHLQVSPMSPVL